MKCAVHAKELEKARVDGTMVYLYNVLRAMRELIMDDQIFLYHNKEFNRKFHDLFHAKYQDRLVCALPMWTQSAFAHAVWQDHCDVLWMPLHNMPLFHRSGMRTVVTIHDVAFKFFPDTYPACDRWRLNLLTDHVVRHADEIIAISETTKRDLLKVYPFLRSDHIHVVYHGFDPHVWQRKTCDDVLHAYGVRLNRYIIHVGAIQPRKNLITLIDAFEIIKKNASDMKLVLVGGDGWLAKKTHERITRSIHRDDIIVTGNISFQHTRALLSGAQVCVLPSLYEGFGLPGLEAMAVGVPVVAARNGCFEEILGDGAVYFDPNRVDVCADMIMKIINDIDMRSRLHDFAVNRISELTWHKTAQKTLAILRNDAY